MCGDCAAGCFDSMIGDGQCDPACNTADCAYDGNDCSCNAGCLSYYDGGTGVWTWDTDPCNLKCLVQDCLFNYEVCTDEFLIRASWFQQIETGNPWNVLDLTSCYAAETSCIEGELETIDSDGVCSSECDALQCLDCMGLSSPLITCTRGSSMCYLCLALTQIYDFCMICDCPPGYQVIDSLTPVFLDTPVCLKEPLNYSYNNLYKIYMSTDGAIDNDGTQGSPINSLSVAFQLVTRRFTKILISPGEYYYDKQPSTSCIVTDLTNPLMTIVDLHLEELWIAGSDATDRPVIYLTNTQMKIKSKALKLYIINVIFNGQYALQSSCSSDLCMYCPYLSTPISGYSLNDRNQLIEDTSQYAQNCNTFNSFSFITVPAGSSLTMDTVDVINCQQQFKSFINSQGSLTLTRVNFNRIQSAASQAWIYMSCSSNCDSVDFSYSEGNITNLNYGYEYLPDTVQSGFLDARNINSVSLYGILVDYAMVATGISVTASTYLLYTLDLLSTISINSCQFQNSLLNSLLYADASRVVYSNLTINYYSEVQQFVNVQLLITDSSFTNIGTFASLIYYKMETIVQNVKICRCTFTNIVANGEGVISILNMGTYSEMDTDGGWISINVNGLNTIGYVYSRSINMLSLDFSEVYYAGTLLRITEQPNVNINSLSTSSTRDMTYQDYNDIVISAFIAGKAYLSVDLLPDSVVQNQCNSLISIGTSVSSYIDTLSITNSQCTNGCNALYAYSVSVLQLSNIDIEDIESDSENDVISIGKCTTVSIDSSILKNITTTNSGSLQVMQVTTLEISYLNGCLLSSTFHSPIFLNTATDVTITSFTCNYCESTLGNGGGLYILTSTNQSNIAITDFTCNNCNSDQGYGGAVYIDSPSISIKNWIVFENFNIANCHAADGAALFISDRVSLVSGCINNLLVEDSNANLGAIIYDYHKTGMLSITHYTSRRNIGYYAGIYGVYSSNELVLEMSTVTIDSSTSYDSACFFSSLISSTSVILTDIILSNNIDIRGIKASKIAITINTLSINYGGGLDISDSVRLTGNKLHFAYLSDTAIRATLSSSVRCSDCEFLHSTSGPALFIENNSTVTVSSSIFNNITSTTSSMAIYLNLCPGSNKFTGCNFTNSVGLTGPLMDIQSSSLEMVSCTVSENSSPSITAGINLMSSSIYITASYFSYQIGIMAGFLALSTQSVAVIDSSTFDHGIVSGSGGAISSIMSSAVINKCAFTQNSAGSSGGAIYAATLSNFTITSCNFNGNSGSVSSAIYFAGVNLTISDSNFYFSKGGTGPILYVDNANSFIFKRSVIGGENLQGIVSLYCSEFIIDSSTFIDLYPAVSDTNTQTASSPVHTISYSTFSSNIGNPNGGALSLSGSSIAILNCSFDSNSAENGGAISYACPNSQCNITITNSTFINNRASVQGGAIDWVNRKPIQSGNTFTNNTAPYGGDSASFPALLQPQVSRSRLLSSALVCAPGNSCNQTITINLMDSAGNVVTNDNSSTALMSSLDPAYSISGVSKATALSGVFTFVNYTIYGDPGTSVNISIATSSIDPTQGIEAGDTVPYSSSLIYNITLRNCTLGEQIGTESCTLCSPNSYTIQPAISCQNCPVGGNCPGGWNLYPIAGYWKTSMYSEELYECPLAAACLGSLSEEDFVGSCADGYAGYKCFGCDVGYSRSGTNKCGKCPTTGNNVAIIIGLAFFIVFVTAVLVRSTINSAYSLKSLHSIYIKIFTNYLQMILLTTKFNLLWPSYVLQLFNAQQTIATATDQVYSLDCYFTNKGRSYENIYYNKLIMTVLLPPIVWTIAIIVWVFICIKKGNWKYFKREVFTTLIIIFFLIYPNIVEIIFDIFSCTFIGEFGYWVSSNLIVKCYDDVYIEKSITLGLTGIIFWAIGVPTIVLVIISKRRKFLQTDENRVIFGFLFNGYKKSRFFWEFIIMYRKILIIAILVFFNTVGITIQALNVTLVLFTSLYLQYEFKPYNRYQLNKMEIEAILTATITIYCGLYYLDALDVGDVFRGVLFCFIILGNAYFIFHWLFYMFYAVLDILSNYIYCLRKIRGRLDQYPDIINSEKIALEGVVRNEEEGILQFTMLPKKKTLENKINLQGIANMSDIHSRVSKRILKAAKSISFKNIKKKKHLIPVEEHPVENQVPNFSIPTEMKLSEEEEALIPFFNRK